MEIPAEIFRLIGDFWTPEPIHQKLFKGINCVDVFINRKYGDETIKAFRVFDYQELPKHVGYIKIAKEIFLKIRSDGALYSDYLDEWK